MSLSLKQELEIHARAVEAYDKGDFDDAYRHFAQIADTSSKIRFNMAVVLATTGRYEDAIVQYQAALRMDRYLAVAYFQLGVSNFLLGRFEEAHGNFDDAFLYLRGNAEIDYEQLGMTFSLYACEVLFNRGLSLISQGIKSGLLDVKLASQQKQRADHHIIDLALRAKAVGHTVFSIPVGTLYRPDQAKLRNITVKDYLGKAKLIASADISDVSTDFRGSDASRRPAGQKPSKIADSQEIARALSRFSLKSTTESFTTLDKHVDHAREMEFHRLDEALVRKASVSTLRERFPLPARSRSLFRKPSTLPPTPPRTDSRASSRKSSYAASETSLKEASTDVRGNLFRSLTTGRKIAAEKPLPGLAPADKNWGSLSKQVHSVMNTDTETFSQRLALLQKELPAQESESNSTWGKSSVSANSQLETYAEDDMDLIDDYYSQSSFSAYDAPSPPESPVMKVKVKVCGLEDTRSITFASNVTMTEFQARLREKFGWHELPKLRTRDEDGELILLQDQEDLADAMHCAVCEAQDCEKDVGRFDIWVKA